ncbi:MAG: permease-like cell division protein FtsX [Alistipes sp.]|nr:permease-like cell division protein FtsX [Alistipes sp.]MBQ1958118.1 permease-like cell division protein FtsX [Alistipes sp.]MBQ1980143.1 permease-like cell division protein FtsX [Alistipes sp.]MBQ2415219.1 permease-like cell division protein FtsX [Alistipes sp.]MBQ5623100.1 permease-like cell division protein FtsX [Alistipes sp.]
MRSDKRIRRKVRRSYMVSTVSISLVLFLLGSVGYMLSAALSTAHTLRGSITLSVELDQAMEQGAKDALGEKLSEMEGVSGVEYVSRQEKIEDEDFRRMFASEIESILADNPLRDSFEVGITTADKQKRDEMVDQISVLDGVVYVAYPASTIEQLHSTINRITIILIAFGGALLIISLILLNNTIRLAIFSRRYLINTLKLVGATKWYIMRPFLSTAAKQGFWSGILASLLFGAALAGLSEAMPEIISMSELIKIGIIVGVMILGGLLISILFTTFAVGKFVNMKSNKIYLY